MSVKLLFTTTIRCSKLVAFKPNLSCANLSSRSGAKKPLKRKSPPPSTLAVHEAWEEVKDAASGQIYYWNTQTNETTVLGAPKPTGPTAMGPSQTSQLAEAPQQSGGMMSGLGGMVAQGFAFGVGSSVAHSVVGSMFGGSSGGDSGGGDCGGDDGGFDV